MRGSQPGRSRVRFLTSTFAGAVLLAAATSSLSWGLVPAPTEQELQAASAELVEGRPFAGIDTLYLDSSHLGPREVRGTFAEPLDLALEPFDEERVQRIRADGEAAGWDATIIRDPDDVRVEARRDGRLAEVKERQIDLIATTPVGVNLAVGMGAIAGGLVGAAVNRARQRRTEPARTRRWRLAVAAGLLPGFTLLAAALPLFLVPDPTAIDLGDYGSLVLGVLVFFAGFWVPVAVVIAVVTWLVARPRPVRSF